MKKPDIQLVITSLAPEPVQHCGKSGGDVRLLEILRRMDKNFSLDIFCIATPYNRTFFLKNGIRSEFRIVKSNLKFKSLPGLCVKSLLTLIKSFFVLKLDFLESKDKKVIIYSSSDLFWEVIPAFFYKMRNKNIEWVQVIHHIYPDWKKRLGKRMENFFGYYAQRFSFWLIKKKSDKIILVNSLAKKKLTKMGFPENKTFVSSNGINLEYFDQIEKTDVSYEGVFLGRLSHSKGLADLVKIWKNVCQEFPRAKLAVAGGGSKQTTSFLSKKITGNKLEKNIDLLGFLDDKKAYSILKTAKIFVFPSREEGWGIVVAEAMACGLPVVSWDLPVFKEIFEDQTIQLKETDVELFSKKVIALLKDEEIRKEIGRNGKEFIKKYSWEKVAKRELEIISS